MGATFRSGLAALTPHLSSCVVILLENTKFIVVTLTCAMLISIFLCRRLRVGQLGVKYPVLSQWSWGQILEFNWPRFCGPGGRFSKVPRTFQAWKTIHKTMTCLFCKGNKNKNNCRVSCLKTPSFWRYKENYVTQNTPEKFRDFRETGPRCDNVDHSSIRDGQNFCSSFQNSYSRVPFQKAFSAFLPLSFFQLGQGSEKISKYWIRMVFTVLLWEQN